MPSEQLKSPVPKLFHSEPILLGRSDPNRHSPDNGSVAEARPESRPRVVRSFAVTSLDTTLSALAHNPNIRGMSVFPLRELVAGSIIRGGFTRSAKVAIRQEVVLATLENCPAIAEIGSLDVLPARPKVYSSHIPPHPVQTCLIGIELNQKLPI